MADRPAQNLVRQAALDYILLLAWRDDIRNELYVQVIKQLTNNPNPRSYNLGWQLLLSLCQTAPGPSPDLLPYVHLFLSRVSENDDTDIGTTATHCSQALQLKTLPKLRGHLWKRKPAKIVLKAWDWRFIVVENYKFWWWASQEDADRKEGALCKGIIDFMVEEAIVERDGETVLRIKPRHGWSEEFEHAAGNPQRIFLLDCKGSEHDQKSWMQAIQANMSYADRFRGKARSYTAHSIKVNGTTFQCSESDNEP